MPHSVTCRSNRGMGAPAPFHRTAWSGLEGGQTGLARGLPVFLDLPRLAGRRTSQVTNRPCRSRVNPLLFPLGSRKTSVSLRPSGSTL